MSESHDLTDPANQPYSLEAALAVIASGSAARDLHIPNEALSRLVQARDKLAHVYWIDEVIPGYLISLISHQVSATAQY